MPANERAGIHVNQPKTADERSKVATTCAASLKLSMPCVVDGIDNKVGDAYAAWPDRLYIVDKEGKIAYKSEPGPRGFKVDEMAAKLKSITAPEK
jgi:hypothetical protein